jgi:hypothetical protein
VRNTVVGGNRLALDAAARASRQLGYRTLSFQHDRGRDPRIARVHAAIARARSLPPGAPRRPPASSPERNTVTIMTMARAVAIEFV